MAAGVSLPVTFALVGYGGFAEMLVEQVFERLQQVRVVAVCDPDPARRAAAATRLAVPTYGDIEKLLAGSDSEALAILTPHDTHRGMVERAAAAGRHVFCEKAMAVSVEDCEAMISATEEAGVTLAVGHMQKLQRPHARVAALAGSGLYGRPVAVDVAGYHWCPVVAGWWRAKTACGGLLYWAGVHELDTMRAIVQDDVREVFAVAGPRTDDYTEYESSIVVTIRFERGALGTLRVAELDPLREWNRAFAFHVVCERGAIRYDPDAGVVEHAGRSGQVRSELTVERFPDLEEYPFDAYRREFEGFARCIREGGNLIIPAADGLRAVELMEAAYDSVAHARPVRLPQRNPA